MRKGFTLIELLVVIAIIAILAAILFPVFARAREKARQSTCLSNVKQITLSILQYAQDYDERFPFAYSTPPNSADRKGLIQITQPYIQNWQIHNCPSADMESNTSYLGNRSYGYHTALIPAAAAGVEVLATFEDKIVMCRQGNLLASAFHPELTDDRRVQQYFLDMID